MTNRLARASALRAAVRRNRPQPLTTTNEREPMTTDYEHLERHHVEYLNRIPEAVPTGRWVVHNHVRPALSNRHHGADLPAAWLTDPTPTVEICECGWAPELDRHYRVVR